MDYKFIFRLECTSINDVKMLLVVFRSLTSVHQNVRSISWKTLHNLTIPIPIVPSLNIVIRCSNQSFPFVRTGNFQWLFPWPTMPPPYNLTRTMYYPSARRYRYHWFTVLKKVIWDKYFRRCILGRFLLKWDHWQWKCAWSHIETVRFRSSSSDDRRRPDKRFKCPRTCI
jgi:hypothetical protein